MTEVINYFIIFCYIFVSFKVCYYLLTLLQQNGYKLYSPFIYMCSLFKRRTFIYLYIISIIIYFLYLNISFPFSNYIYLLYYSFLFGFSFVPFRFIKPLRITKRVVRIITLMIFIFILSFSFSKSFIYITFLPLFIPIIIFIASLLLLPIEKGIVNYYSNKASTKLKNSKALVIAITGSSGKTTLKTYLYSMLKNYYNVIASNSSYNTVNGISMFINKELSSLTDIVILEFGATKENDIKELTKLFPPDIGVITNITYQHMKSFKNIETVLKTKWELPIYMKKEGYLVLNGDNPYLSSLIAKNLSKTYHVGFSQDSYLDIIISSFKDNIKGSMFNLSNEDKNISINTKLLGKVQALNIALAYGIILGLRKKGISFSDESFIYEASNLISPKNRLEEKKLNNYITILDDSYNSNLDGFINALKVLNIYKGLHILITPGIVDLSYYEKECTDKLLPYLKDLNELIIIPYKGNKIFRKNMKENGIKFSTFKSFNKAYLYVLKKYQKIESTLLIENDLPDSYLWR